MYCPKCKKEFPGKFCPKCGERLIEEPLQNDINLNLSDKASVMGGLNVMRNDSHNTTNLDQSVTYNSYITNTVKKSDTELHHERIQMFLECCRRVFRNGLIIEEEKIQLETERIRLGINETDAARIIEQARKTSGTRMTSLSMRDEMTIKKIDSYIENNNVAILGGQIARLSALTHNYNIEAITYRYYMLLAALQPQQFIHDYEANTADEYWQTFWAVVAYLKCENSIKAEEAIVKLDLYPNYPEENSLLLSALSTYKYYGSEEAVSYINAVFPEDCSPLLMPFIQALFITMLPERIAEIGANEEKCKFYIDTFIDEKGAKLRAIKEVFDKAVTYYNEGLYTKAIELFRPIAEQGHAAAQCYIGDCYLDGNGVNKNREEAEKWYRKAAEQGYAGAQYGLGNCYFDKCDFKTHINVEENLEEAIKWWQKASDQGHIEAIKALLELDIEDETYVKWAMKAVEFGITDCMPYIDDYYFREYSRYYQVEEEVLKFFIRTAEQGDPIAQYRLGFYYQYGIEGIDKNEKEAKKWYIKAALQGHEDAKQLVNHIIQAIHERGNTVCTNCGEEVDADTKFCRMCGTKIDAKQLVNHKIQEIHERGNTVCTNCGEEVDADTKFCRMCGTKIKD